jgi:hypothetical protein
MYRVEIISNKSVEEDITEALEEFVPGICYTSIPLAYGRGKDDYKLGTTTWPETNFVLVSYVEDKDLNTVRSVLAGVKNKFSSEGIKLFVVKAEDF